MRDETDTTNAAQERKPDRLDRGLELWRSRRQDIRQRGAGCWSVPSGSGSGAYLVDLQARTCDCRDKQYNAAPGEMCKHGWAAVFAAHHRVIW